WHSNYGDPLDKLHEELNVTWGFHEGVAASYSRFTELYGENRFYRHVASHWIEMQQSLIAMIIGGVFEFYPKLRVGFLEAQNSWAPGLLSRIEWDYPQYRDSHAPYLSLTPREHFPHVSENLLKNVPRKIAEQILVGGAHLYGFTEADFKKADAARAA